MSMTNAGGIDDSGLNPVNTESAGPDPDTLAIRVSELPSVVRGEGYTGPPVRYGTNSNSYLLVGIQDGIAYYRKESS